MRSIRSSGVGNCLFLRARVWGKDRGVAEGMVTSKFEPCITSLPCGDLKTLSRVTSFGQRIISFKVEAKIAFGKRII